VGKSTLLLSAAGAWAAAGQGPVLIVSGEESAAQVKLRADRMGALHPDIYLAAESDLSAVLGQVDQVAPRLLIVDSVQTIASGEVDGSAGGVSQVRAVAAALSAVAKERNMACVLVGHVTKDGAIAGPRVLEHLVDVVLQFEGDRHSTLRTVRGVKNRYGPSDEVGCFQMVPDGIVGLADPSGLFLTNRRAPVPGTCATITLQGRRALPAELQTLIVASSGEVSRRTVSGLDSARAAMVIAVLQRWGGVAMAGKDVLAATVGGAKMTEPAADLPLALAIWSSVRDIPLAAGLVVVGELGLAADVRPVSGLARRLTEAARLGFDHAVVPEGVGADRPRGMRVDEVANLGDAFRSLGNDDGVVQWLRRRSG
jgi:DNA repair protein RadA/Sms